MAITRRRVLSLVCTAALLTCVSTRAADPTGGPVDLSAIIWVQQSTGVRTAVCFGDPTAPGLYSSRSELPPNWHIAPHTHPEDVRVATVVSGKFYWAKGDTFDESKLQELGPGSVIVEAKGVAHFAMTKGEGAVLQVTAVGPSGLRFVSDSK